MRAAARREDGFTLIELMVAALIGTVVLLAAFRLVDVSVVAQAENENRLEALQRGRLAMESITRGVRSTLCPATGATPIESASATRLKFYSSLVSEQSGMVRLQKRVLTYEPVAGTTRGRITERVYENKGTASAPVWWDTPDNDKPDRTRVIVDHVTPTDGADVFRYSRFDPSVTKEQASRLIAVTAPVAEDQLPFVAQVRVTFTAWPVGAAAADRVKTGLDSRVFIRTADPTTPTNRTRCL